jgi:hypothetical protein
MPAGRPSTYKPEYCEAVIEMGRKGYSVVEMAAEIGVGRTTLERDWPSDHPEFSQAMTHARECSQAWWERIGRDNLIIPHMGGTFQASVWSRSMAARFPHDWRESSKVDHTSSDGSMSPKDASAAVLDALKRKHADT